MPSATDLRRKRAITANRQLAVSAQAAVDIAAAGEHFAAFRSALEKFAAEKRAEINRDPALRHEFMQMCVSVGVDPLRSRRGQLGRLMGGLGRFYDDLGVRALTAAVASRADNGGVLRMSVLLLQLNAGGDRGGVSAEDVKHSLARAREALGSGVRIAKAGGEDVVVSVAAAMDADQQKAVDLAGRHNGQISLKKLEATYGWERTRVLKTSQWLVREGMGWYDVVGGEQSVWLPGLFDAQLR